jgi:hypothetical protein
VLDFHNFGVQSAFFLYDLVLFSLICAALAIFLQEWKDEVGSV